MSEIISGHQKIFRSIVKSCVDLHDKLGSSTTRVDIALDAIMLLATQVGDLASEMDRMETQRIKEIGDEIPELEDF